MINEWDKGKLFLMVECQIRNIEGMMALKKVDTDNQYSKFGEELCSYKSWKYLFTNSLIAKGKC